MAVIFAAGSDTAAALTIAGAGSSDSNASVALTSAIEPRDTTSKILDWATGPIPVTSFSGLVSHINTTLTNAAVGATQNIGEFIGSKAGAVALGAVIDPITKQARGVTLLDGADRGGKDGKAKEAEAIAGYNAMNAHIARYNDLSVSDQDETVGNVAANIGTAESREAMLQTYARIEKGSHDDLAAKEKAAAAAATAALRNPTEENKTKLNEANAARDAAASTYKRDKQKTDVASRIVDNVNAADLNLHGYKKDFKDFADGSSGIITDIKYDSSCAADVTSDAGLTGATENWGTLSISGIIFFKAFRESAKQTGSKMIDQLFSYYFSHIPAHKNNSTYMPAICRMPGSIYPLGGFIKSLHVNTTTIGRSGAPNAFAWEMTITTAPNPVAQARAARG